MVMLVGRSFLLWAPGTIRVFLLTSCTHSPWYAVEELTCMVLTEYIMASLGLCHSPSFSSLLVHGAVELLRWAVKQPEN